VKKNYFLIGIFIACLIFLMYTMRNPQSTQDIVSDRIGIDVSASTVISVVDTYGGFHGDGMICLGLQFNDDSLIDQIDRNAMWNRLPLDGVLASIVYSSTDENIGFEPLICDEEGNSLIPQIQKGYYCFIDRHSESKDTDDYSKILNRSSYNFTLAVYDEDSRILYFSQLDT